MHYIVDTKIGTIASYMFRYDDTPEIPEFLTKLKKLGQSNVKCIRDICDYLDASPKQLLVALLRQEGAIEAYRKASVELKIATLDNMLDIVSSDVTEKTLPIIERAWEFIAHNFARNTLDADRTRYNKKDIEAKAAVSARMARIAESKVRIDKESLKLRQDDSFIKVVTDKDEETLKKIQRHINQKSGPSR